MKKCNSDCFNCVFDDCILNDKDIALNADIEAIEKHKAVQREKYRKNRESILAYQKRYRIENHDRIIAQERARNKKKKLAGLRNDL